MLNKCRKNSILIKTVTTKDNEQLFAMAFWNRDEKGTQALSDLIRGLQHSVNAAMEMIETRNIELLGRL